jgi:hypothetical protein
MNTKTFDGKSVIKGVSLNIGDTIRLDANRQYIKITDIYIKYKKKTKVFETFIEADYFNSSYNLGNNEVIEITEHWKQSITHLKNWLRNYYNENISYD